MSEAITAEELAELDAPMRAALVARAAWEHEARHKHKSRGKQIPPTEETWWNVFLMLAGRGFGKSRSLSEIGWWEAWRVPGVIGHMIAPNKGDLKKVNYEGPTGLLSCIPYECLLGGSQDRGYNKTDHIIYLNNGSRITGFGATDDGDALRGPASHFTLCDEVAKWDKPAGNLKEAFHNAALGTRMIYPDGTPSRMYLGGTPKPIPFLRELMQRPDVCVVRGTTYDNLDNLSANFKAEILVLEGTVLGRQEIHAELIDADEVAIFKRSWFPLWTNFKPDGTKRKLPEFIRIVESYDTASSEENYDAKKQETDPTASIVLGVFNVAQCFTEAERNKIGFFREGYKDGGKVGVKGRYAALLCEAWSERLGAPELLDKARAQHKIKWGTPGRKADVVIIEDKSSGPGLRQNLVKWNVPVFRYNPGGMNKTQRANAVSPLVAQRMVFLPESMVEGRSGRPRDWVEPFLDQVCAFAGPGSVEHDDFVDAFSQALLYLHNQDLLTPSPQGIAFPDAEEKREQDEREAERLHEEERRRKRGNPYSA